MGTLEILVILLLAFIFLGPERMVEAAHRLGKALGEFRKLTSEMQVVIQEEMPKTDSDLNRQPFAAAQESQSTAKDDQIYSQDIPSDASKNAPVAYVSGADYSVQNPPKESDAGSDV